MRKTLLAVSILILGLIIFFQANKIIKIIDLSSMDISVDSELEIKKVKVIQGFFSINRENDAEMFKYKNPKVVFDGKETGKLTTEYGENDFLIIYDNKYYFEFRNIVIDDDESSTYDFILRKEKNQIFIDGEIFPRNLKFKQKMNLISDAEKLLCNFPIDSTKGIYDGIKLNPHNK